MGLDRFFIWQVDPALLLTGVYEPWLVAMSVGVAIFASTMGLHVAWQAGRTQHLITRRVMILAGSAALGTGVWAMHFLGMLAFRLCTPVDFAAGWTMFSFLPALGAAYVALSLLSRPDFDRPLVVVGGALMGAGIGVMHYAGMAGMQLAALLRYDFSTFGLSLAVAMVLSIMALGLRFGLDARLQAHPFVITLISGSFMGAAISGMHYTGMSAARFIGHDHSADAKGLIDPTPLALGITLVTVVATVLVAGAIALARYRQLLESMTDQSRKLQKVFDTSIDGIVVFDQLGRVQSFNAGAQRITGWAADEVVGQPLSLVMESPWREEAELNFITFTYRLKLDVAVETHLRRHDGTALPVRLTIGRTQIEEGFLFVASFADIREQQAMQKALRHSEQQFRSLIGNIPGISFRFQMTKGWPMVFVSDAVEAFTGHGPKDFLGDRPAQSLFEVVPTEQRSELRLQIVDAVLKDRPFRLEFQMRHLDGSLRWMWGTGQSVRSDDGETTWVDGVLLDITDRRDMEEALRGAKQQAEEAMHSRTAFLANMSHEIRTPMNAIIGFTEVVLAVTKDAEVRQHLLTVRSAARSLMVLLNDILDSSKLERGAMELEHLPYQLRQVMKQVADEQVLTARRKGLQLLVKCDPAVPEVLVGDSHRVRQVLVNLVGNALKFTHQGEVEIGARLTERDDLHLWVRDTGIGIAADRIDHIFEAFAQADASMSRRFGGTGLGTTICRQLVELMGGRIWVESREGEGTTFHMALPCEISQGPAPNLYDTQPGALGISDKPRQWRILVVDDAPDNCDLLSVILAHEGHEAVVAHGGEEAVARHAQGDLDLVLMDLQMPGMDGFAASRAIRAQEARLRLDRVPVLALSATKRSDTMQVVMAAGMDGFLLKPIKPAVLLGEVHRLQRARRAMAPAPTSEGGEPILLAQQARERWGDDVAWAQALAQFCRHKRDWLRNNDPDAPPHGADALAEAHRFRGVAATLSMPALGAAATELEQLIQRKLPLGECWMRLNRVVHETLAAAQAEWEAVTSAQGIEVPLTLSTEATLSDDEIARDLQEMVDGLRRGEYPDAVWQRMSAAGSQRFGAVVWAGLTQAIQDFDFDAAAQRAQALLTSLRTPA